MIKSFSAYTYEIDDVDLAVNEMREQLDLEGKLRKNSIGILTCYSEYIESLVVKELCSVLPFPVVGITTIANGCQGVIGEMMLNLMVLTSDSVQFAAGLSEPVSVDDTEALRIGYEKVLAELPGKPSLLLTFAPLIFDISGDYFVENLNRITGNVPNFGTLAVDHTENYSESKVIFKGECYQDRCAFVLLYGDFHPKFYVGHISKERIFADKGIVTASKGNLLQMVNSVPVVDYLQTLGLEQDDNGFIGGLDSFPVIVDYNDGSEAIAWEIFALTEEKYAVCGGYVPEGSTINIGKFDKEDIKLTTDKLLKRAVKENPHSTFLILSCAVRYYAQESDLLGELELVSEYMKNMGNDYLFAYSGGEICPVYAKDGHTHNRSHNLSIVICAL